MEATAVRLTALGPLHIAPARPEDLEAVLEVLSEAAAWLASQGIRQWRYPLPEGMPRLLQRTQASGDLIVARLAVPGAGPAAATLRFGWSHPEYWPADPEAAGYVYGLAIHPSLRGHGLGAALLDWAGAQARSRGRRYLRLDCSAGNARLRRYYEGLGFICRGEVEDEDYRGALYEREA